MRISYHITHRHAICLKFADMFLTSLTKLLLKAKTSIYSTIKEIILLPWRNFSTF